MKQLRALEAFLNGASERERLLILAALTAALLLGGYHFAIDPIQRHIKQLGAQVQETQAQQALVAAEMQALLSNDPDDQRSPLRQRLEHARAALADVNAQLQASGKQFLDDRELARWLAQLLETRKDIRVIGIDSLPAEQVYPAPQGNAATPSGPALYRKGVELRFLGNYAAAYRYFQRLEQSPWPLEWGSLDYQSKAYPQGEVRVVAYTYILGPDVAAGAGVAQSPGDGGAALGTLDRRLDPGFASARRDAAGAPIQVAGAP
ncbi:MAG: hypothetical protein ACOY5C_07250 [Pseudomonadota bacterium]|uniref:hypothetical protein n=1 Tax=Thermithiobacillus tepidarius TaxID=929 RepID=UPI00041D59E5|nr:hypothetical protein [Thermithiobacillus tepidarius]